ncbi:hypothetical protein [Chthonobacter rhizosphaerae]|uniref:hypothetical protein n=1 Tax=Chthonobacter rhizosphaerae TaxID=2735553 RepID=UPI0015EF60EA|nr:hypothetical protein [Chthonobacter rhizosphaerae]
MTPWHAAFGSEVNQGQNSASVTAANGIGNSVDGAVVAEATQVIGDVEHGFDYDPAFEMNTGFNSADVNAGNGLLNSIDGGVFAIADQTVGDVDLGFPLPILF